tara:strand:+ start:3393 stop:4475 length:1083 start_codon:yes stop_codon:yes gene_type:complete
MPPRVCVIVPTVNNHEELSVALEGLTNQTYSDSEIVVVGPDGDRGRSVANEMGVRYIDDEGSKTRADACNVAISSTESELVFFTDDDVIVPEGWVSRLVKWFDREEVAGVGGPNFAPVDESGIWQRAIDVSFCNRVFTMGTNYGRKAEGELEEVNQLPGVNSAYRRSVLEDVGGFDKGSIGAEDVMLDHRIRLAGYRLWSDGEAIIWHRRRGLNRVKMQIRNYGMVRVLSSKKYPELWGLSHSLVSAFPLIVILSFATFLWGLTNGGVAWPNFWDISLLAVPMGPERVAVHQFPTLVILYNIIAWGGGASGSSPSRSPLTVFLSSVVSYILHWNYAIGILKGRMRIMSGSDGLQIDDRER